MYMYMYMQLIPVCVRVHVLLHHQHLKREVWYKKRLPGKGAGDYEAKFVGAQWRLSTVVKHGVSISSHAFNYFKPACNLRVL